MKQFCKSQGTRGRDRRKTIAAMTLCATLVAFVRDGYCVELIRNGSFEEGARGGIESLRAGWDDGPGLGSDIGYVVRPYPFGDCGDDWCSESYEYDPPGLPGSGESGPIGRGRHYASNLGWANGREILGSATQHVDLEGHAGSPFEFTAWFASDIGDTDYAIVTLEFFSGLDAMGDSLDVMRFDGNNQQSPFIVGSANDEGRADPMIPATQDNWTLYRAAGRIPSNAVSAAVVLRDGTVTGVNGNDGYVDLVSLQVIPEPMSVLLLGAAAVTGALVFRTGSGVTGRT